MQDVRNGMMLCYAWGDIGKPLLWVPIKGYKQTLQEIQYTLLWVPIKDYKQNLQET